MWRHTTLFPGLHRAWGGVISHNTMAILDKDDHESEMILTCGKIHNTQDINLKFIFTLIPSVDK
jgi:hypothetical protein